MVVVSSKFLMQKQDLLLLAQKQPNAAKLFVIDKNVIKVWHALAFCASFHRALSLCFGISSYQPFSA